MSTDTNTSPEWAPDVYVLPSGEATIIELMPPTTWAVIFWGCLEDFQADRAENPAGEWLDRASCSLTFDTMAEALAELGPEAVLQ